MSKKVEKEKGDINMDYHLIKERDLFLLTDQAGNIIKNEDGNMVYTQKIPDFWADMNCL